MAKKINDSILEIIGNTPLLRLNKIGEGLAASLLLKLEYLNPSGSLKDRIALEMIQQGAASGKLKPGDTIVESSTGNTGTALSLVGRLLGYKVCIYETMPGKAGAEKTKMMTNVGAEVRLMEPEDIQALKERSIAGLEVELPGRVLCYEDEKSKPGIWWARQFSSQDNVGAHHVTAREILEQTDGKVDIFVQSIGTGGSLVGVGEILKKECPGVRVIGIQPDSSKNTLKPGMDFPASEVKGGIVTEMLKRDGLIDDIVRIKDAEAREMTHRLWREEGVFCGVSSGANVLVARREAEKLGRKGNVVTIACDSMSRYMTEERYVT